MNRPQTYHDWRELYHQTAKLLGWHIQFQLEFHGRLFMDRTVWQYHSRLRRIQLRLDAEKDAGTESWCRAVLSALGLTAEDEENG